MTGLLRSMEYLLNRIGSIWYWVSMESSNNKYHKYHHSISTNNLHCTFCCLTSMDTWVRPTIRHQCRLFSHCHCQLPHSTLESQPLTHSEWWFHRPTSIHRTCSSSRSLNNTTKYWISSCHLVQSKMMLATNMLTNVGVGIKCWLSKYIRVIMEKGSIMKSNWLTIETQTILFATFSHSRSQLYRRHPNQMCSPIITHKHILPMHCLLLSHHTAI